MTTKVLSILLLSGFGYCFAQQVDLSACASANWGGCAVSIAHAVYRHYGQWNDGMSVTLGPHQCVTNIKGNFYRWKWVWSGKIRCPGLSHLEGQGNNLKSRGGAIEHAIADLMEKYRANNILTADQWRVLTRSIEEYARSN